MCGAKRVIDSGIGGQNVGGLDLRHVGRRKLGCWRHDEGTASRMETGPERAGTPLSTDTGKGVSHACRSRLYSASNVATGPVALPIDFRYTRFFLTRQTDFGRADNGQLSAVGPQQG